MWRVVWFRPTTYVSQVTAPIPGPQHILAWRLSLRLRRLLEHLATSSAIRAWLSPTSTTDTSSPRPIASLQPSSTRSGPAGLMDGGWCGRRQSRADSGAIVSISNTARVRRSVALPSRRSGVPSGRGLAERYGTPVQDGRPFTRRHAEPSDRCEGLFRPSSVVAAADWLTHRPVSCGSPASIGISWAAGLSSRFRSPRGR